MHPWRNYHHCHHCHCRQHCHHHDNYQVAPEVRQFPLPDGADYTEVLANTTTILMKITRMLDEDDQNVHHDQDEHVDDQKAKRVEHNVQLFFSAVLVVAGKV